MERNEVAKLLNEIDLLYPGRIRMDEKQAAARFNLFCKVLANKNTEEVEANLIAHAEESPHPPSVHALVKKQEKSNVPSVEETRAYIQRYEDMPEPDEETLQAMEEAKKEIRRILKMDIDGSGSE